MCRYCSFVLGYCRVLFWIPIGMSFTQILQEYFSGTRANIRFQLPHWQWDYRVECLWNRSVPYHKKHKHDDVIKWKHFAHYWIFVRGIHRSPVNSPHKGQWRGALMFSLICAWLNGWVSNREAGDLRRHRAHYDVIVAKNVRVYLVMYSVQEAHTERMQENTGAIFTFYCFIFLFYLSFVK